MTLNGHKKIWQAQKALSYHPGLATPPSADGASLASTINLAWWGAECWPLAFTGIRDVVDDPDVVFAVAVDQDLGGVSGLRNERLKVARRDLGGRDARLKVWSSRTLRKATWGH